MGRTVASFFVDDHRIQLNLVRSEHGNHGCPPEDCGGIYGFYDLLEALADPEHEDHKDMMRWCGKFDPTEFDAKQATKAMKKGLPDWRE